MRSLRRLVPAAELLGRFNGQRRRSLHSSSLRLGEAGAASKRLASNASDSPKRFLSRNQFCGGPLGLVTFWLPLFTLPVIAVISTVVFLVRQDPIRDFGDCAFDDGRNYCNMANGALADRPFSLRPLIPFLVRITGFLGGDVKDRFLVINLLGIAISLLAMLVIGRHVARLLDVDERRVRLLVVMSGALFVMSPFAVHLVAIAPTMTDGLATGLVMAWLAVLVTYRGAQHRQLMFQILLTVLAVLARETSIVMIAASVVCAYWLGITSRRASMAVVGTGAIALVVDFLQPFHPSDYSALTHFREVTHAWIGRPGALPGSLYMALGCTALALVLMPWSTQRLRSAWPRPLLCLLPSAFVPITLSISGGYDHGRISSVATPTLCILFVLLYVTAKPKTQLFLLTAVLITLVGWAPFSTVNPAGQAYDHVFYGYKIHGISYVVIAFSLVIPAGLVILQNRAMQNRAANLGRGRSTVGEMSWK